MEDFNFSVMTYELLLNNKDYSLVKRHDYICLILKKTNTTKIGLTLPATWFRPRNMHAQLLSSQVSESTA